MLAFIHSSTLSSTTVINTQTPLPSAPGSLSCRSYPSTAQCTWHFIRQELPLHCPVHPALYQAGVTPPLSSASSIPHCLVVHSRHAGHPVHLCSQCRQSTRLTSNYTTSHHLPVTYGMCHLPFEVDLVEAWSTASH